MKKILILMLIGLLAAPLFAEGEGKFASTDRLTGTKNATLNVTLDLSDSQEEGDDPLYSVEVGFSSGADLSSFNTESYAANKYTTPSQVDSISLTLGESTAKGPEDLYVYWIIKSAQGITIDLAMPSALTDGDKTPIDWTASWGSDPVKTIGGASNYNEEGAQILDRTNVDAYGDVGAEKITVETGNILSAAPGTYTGTLKLIITAVDASQSDQSNI